VCLVLDDEELRPTDFFFIALPSSSLYCLPIFTFRVCFGPIAPLPRLLLLCFLSLVDRSFFTFFGFFTDDYCRFFPFELSDPLFEVDRCFFSLDFRLLCPRLSELLLYEISLTCFSSEICTRRFPPPEDLEVVVLGDIEECLGGFGEESSTTLSFFLFAG
jgi:hypothetical protein